MDLAAFRQELHPWALTPGLEIASWRNTAQAQVAMCFGFPLLPKAWHSCCLMWGSWCAWIKGLIPCFSCLVSERGRTLRRQLTCAAFWRCQLVFVGCSRSLEHWHFQLRGLKMELFGELWRPNRANTTGLGSAQCFWPCPGWHHWHYTSWVKLWAGCTGKFLALDRFRSLFPPWKTIPDKTVHARLFSKVAAGCQPKVPRQRLLFWVRFSWIPPPLQAAAGEGSTPALGARSEVGWLVQGGCALPSVRYNFL